MGDISDTPPPAPDSALAGAPAPRPAEGAPVGGGAATVVTEGTGLEGPGSTLGPYKLLQLIGEGGFGVVYMAQQTAPVRRRVALKIVKPGMDTKQVIGRFESERQALAMMDHPNIARVFDAGTTGAGRPYFVMELVKGVPITEYCDDANLTTQERLRLFVTVCDAVQHAHNKGIIHRDLKPSNVLITLHDDKPIIKVIDFGIAKAMNQDLTDATVFTEFRQFIGTPEYMSPEQAAMSGLDVDTRSDIYSLGVMLYELVTGTTPFDSEKLRSAGIAEVQRIIKEEDPPRPSTRISAVSKQSRADRARGSGKRTTAEEIARHRGTDPSSLRRALAGDLDWIVMKCLEKDRQRRYETASELAMDIERFLKREAILAHPPTPTYRMRKFISRNRGLVGAGVGIACALLLTMVALAYGLLEARHERDLTAQRETMARARMVLDGMNAVRDYTTTVVRPVLLGDAANSPTPSYDKFTREMVPAYAARQVFDRVRSQTTGEHAGFVYKEASPNPTNPENTADAFEAGLVADFTSNEAKQEAQGTRIINGKEFFYIARPMRVTKQSCLDCHTTPDLAPKRQIEAYGDKGGYGWKMNEVVAAQIVYAPTAEAVRVENRIATGALIGLGGFFVVAGIASAWVLRRA